MRNTQLLRLRARGEEDVFLLRQRGREVAAAVGLDAQDQIRVATALSDLGRDLLGGDVTVDVEFTLVSEPRPALCVRFQWRDGLPVPTGQVGWVSAIRLMTEVRSEVHPDARGEQRVVSLLKQLPVSMVPTQRQASQLRARLATLARGTVMDELRAQNEELLLTLEALERKQDELIRLNTELEETNRGVLALYSELSDELDETNRGVVALYAELEDKSIQLREAGQAKTRFWANVSHELRAPINSVIGLSRLLLGAGTEPLGDEQRHQVQMVHSLGETLLTLVNELLDAAKAESGRLQPQLAPVDLERLFGQLRGTLRPMVPADQVTLVIEDPPAGATLISDETMLVRILRNLLSNGLKFTEHGEVRLSVRCDGDNWLFLVSDTGIGIPVDQQRRVFEEFHQVPNRLQQHSVGTGLGLPYARKLAELLDGVLELSSTPGTGTELLLRLPALDDAEGSTWGTVLLVDDDEVFRSGFRAMVGDLAATVHEVADGEAALRAATAEPPDLIVLDLNMRGLDGYDCLAALRREPILARVPVVVVTAADPAGVDHAALGADVPVLQKSGLTRIAVRDGVRRATRALRQQGGS